MEDNFKTSKKDIVFESLIKELQPITMKSQSKDFGSGGTHGTNQFRKAEKELSEHTLRFDYQGFNCTVELK
jgi:hypothetical protein